MAKIHTFRLPGFYFSFWNLQEFFSVYRQMFVHKEYEWAITGIDTERPRIIDCGAHIGLSILYFKKKLPKAEIIGFEANPRTFCILEKNIEQNKLSEVSVYNYAVGDVNGEITFYVSKDENAYSWGDSAVKMSWQTGDSTKKIVVPSVRLSSYLDKPVDLIKMNIEGSEEMVLREIESKLQLVAQIVVQYHKTDVSERNDLFDILDLLIRNGYMLSMRYSVSILRPFRRRVKLSDLRKKPVNSLMIRAERLRPLS